jgi:hypothetical protein
MPHGFAVFVAGKRTKQTLEVRNPLDRPAIGVTQPAGDAH